MSDISLSLDLSSTFGSLALHGPNLLVERAVGSQRDHSERCFNELEAALDEAGLKLDQITRYITSIGPGSFTGLRIAFSLLKALAFANDRPVETMSGSEARFLAYDKLHPDLDSRFQFIEVLTFATTRKAVRARFDLTAREAWDGTEDVIDSLAGSDPLAPETLVLLDEKLADQSWMGEERVRFPLKASMLAETITTARSRQIFRTAGELIALAPAYFGSAELKRWEPAVPTPTSN